TIKGNDFLKTCSIVGIGHVGEALAKQFDGVGVHVHAYHPNSKRRTKFASKFKNVKDADFSELIKQPIVLLALPAEEIQTFLNSAQEEITPNKVSPIFVNLSTLIDTKELKNKFSNLQIYGVKMVGHANYLYEYGEGVFVTETPLNVEEFQEIRFLFEQIGTLFEDDEDQVRKINGLAVKRIIETCIDFEKETKSFPD